MDVRDLRQIKKMREQIFSYQRGDIGLQTLIGDLVFLRDALSEVEQEWEYEFTNCVLDLESAYTYNLDKVNGKLELLSQKIVDEALPKLLSLINKMKMM